jgi:cation diffusion facilitator CzcD-associated flavoprotein CzcO
MTAIDTDYLVIGAGAAGMAFTDALIAELDADVVMVDRRHRPGGHWNDVYPFVQLHAPSAFYGVNSRSLGADSIEQSGRDAGFYERATGVEICEYYQKVLGEQLLPSGQVRFFGMSDYVGGDADGHRFVSRLTGAETTVRVRRRVVDATYLETSVPSTHAPSFRVDSEATVIPVNHLVGVADAPSGYTVIGAGKTAMDACMWLLDNGVEADAIRWIRPRDAWIQSRAATQPLRLVTSLIEGHSLQLEAAAEAESVDDLFRRLEASEQLLRIDPAVEPTMYRCAIVSAAERDALRSIENVVRHGRVMHVGADRIVLEDASIPTDRRQVHVDCSAAGLRAAPGRPIFQTGEITLQQVRVCQPTFNAALLAHVEASRDDDREKNRLCPPNPYPWAAVDWMSSNLISQQAQAMWSAEPDLVAWMEESRLNAARGIGDHLEEPRMQQALARLGMNTEPSIAKLEQFCGVATQRSVS